MKTIHSTIFTFFFPFMVAVSQTLPPPKSYFMEEDKQGSLVNTGKVKERYSEDSEGKKHGKYIQYYQNGNVAINGYYQNGMPTGLWQEYTSNNKLKCFTNYLNGKKHGLQAGYCSVYFTITNYLNGLENGEYLQYNSSLSFGFSDPIEFTPSDYKVIVKSLTLLTKGNYINGNKEGKWFEQGQQDGSGAEGFYKNGKYDGEWINTKFEIRSGIPLILYGKGWKVIFKEGNVIAQYDSYGTDLIRKENQANEERIKSDFDNCKSRWEYEQFVSQNPKSKYAAQATEMIVFLKAVETYNRPSSNKIPYAYTEELHDYITKYPSGLKVDSAKTLISLAPQHEDFRKIISYGSSLSNGTGCQYNAYTLSTQEEMEEFAYYDQYYKGLLEHLKKFTNGIYSKRCEELIRKEKEFVIKNANAIYNAISSNMSTGAIDKSIMIGKLILPFKENLHSSYYYPISIELAFAYWAKGETDRTIAIIQENVNAEIHYNNGIVKYKQKVKDYYKGYRSSLVLKDEKLVWEKIKEIIK